MEGVFFYELDNALDVAEFYMNEHKLTSKGMKEPAEQQPEPKQQQQRSFASTRPRTKNGRFARIRSNT